MTNLLGGLALAYLAGNGVLTNSAVIGRGLVRSVRRLAHGSVHDALVEAVASVCAPTWMSFAATAALVMDVVQGAGELAGPALEEMAVAYTDEYAA